MTKLEDLRHYLLRRVADLKRNPDRLAMFVENGSIHFSPSQPMQNYSHRYTMPLTVIVTDWQGSVDDIVITLCEWLLVREPGFNPETALQFETEILANDKVDVLFRLQITERVIVTTDEDGKRQIQHVLPEPPLQMRPDAELQVTSEEDNG